MNVKLVSGLLIRLEWAWIKNLGQLVQYGTLAIDSWIGNNLDSYCNVWMFIEILVWICIVNMNFKLVGWLVD